MKIIFYSILIVACLILLWIEIKDINCPNGPSSPWSECEGEGPIYSKAKPHQTDDVKTLLNKIVISSNVLNKTIYWRKSFLIASLLSWSVWGMIIGEIPEASTFMITTLIFMLPLYFFSNFYQYHHYDPPRRYIIESVEMIKNKLS